MGKKNQWHSHLFGRSMKAFKIKSKSTLCWVFVSQGAMQTSYQNPVALYRNLFNSKHACFSPCTPECAPGFALQAGLMVDLFIHCVDFLQTTSGRSVYCGLISRCWTNELLRCVPMVRFTSENRISPDSLKGWLTRKGTCVEKRDMLDCIITSSCTAEEKAGEEAA